MILNRRAKRIEFYDFRRKFKELCKRTSLEEKVYKRIYSIENDNEDYNVFGKLLYSYEYVKDELPMDDFILNKHKLVYLHIITGVTSNILFGNDFVYLNEFYELWRLWRDAPFWKGYEVWKKLHIMNDDFNILST